MEDLKKYLAALKKHRFWVLCGLIVVVALGTSTKASMDMKRKYDNDAAQIKRAFGSLDSTLAEMPPNEKFIEAMSGEQKKIEDQSFAAWQKGYDLQAPLLKWPKAAEAIGNLPPGKEISESMREQYMVNVMEKEWQRVLEKIRLRRPKADPGAAPMNLIPGMGNNNQGAVEYEGIVYWDENQRKELVQRYKTNSVPSETRVRVTQEDLWIFESLVDIINLLNKDATDSLNAPIKQVLFMDVAKWAVDHAIKEPGAEVKLLAEGEEFGAPPEFSAPPGAGGEEEEKSEEFVLLSQRYLDGDNKPVPAKMVKENPPFAEFNQVFVAMRFVMDQKKIPDLLAACANSPLPIEVRQVLMHFQDIDSKNRAAGLSGGGQIERGHQDCVVEVRGNIYIYNRPTREKLGAGSTEKPAQRSMGIPTKPEEDM